MKKHVDEITKEEMNLVRECFDVFSVNEIAELTKLTYYEVLYCLKRIYPSLDLLPLMTGYSINEKRILVMSDTHIGSKFENLYYVEETMMFGIDKGIYTFVHNGDVIQSDFKNVLGKYRDEDKQVEHLINDFPYDPLIRYIMMFGNHDFNTFSKDQHFMDMFNSRKDFHLLGVKYGYINWLGSTIALIHPTKKYMIPIPFCEAAIVLRGHSHNFIFKGPHTAYVSTMSDDKIQNNKSRPGFLVVTNESDHFLIEPYYFENALICEDERKIFVKK